MRKRSGQVHSRESSATLQLTVSLLYLRFIRRLVSIERIWYDAITFKEERYRVYGVFPLFVYTMSQTRICACTGGCI